MTFRLKISAFINRILRRNGPSLADQCMTVIMHVCSLQLSREETRELAPTGGGVGPMLLSGGAITKIAYRVFDKEADAVDASIKKEPWRAFAEVTMLLTVSKDPEFEVKVDGKPVKARDIHKAPGFKIMKHLADYFPLMALRIQTNSASSSCRCSSEVERRFEEASVGGSIPSSGTTFNPADGVSG